MMLDVNLARTHRNNIDRYRRLLETKLSDLERQYIERRLTEELLKLDELSASAFPIQLPPLSSPNAGFKHELPRHAV